MHSKQASVRATMAVLLAALAALLCVSIPFAGATKKKGAKARTFSSGVINAVVPDDPGGNADGLLELPLDVGKKFKGRRIDDVNVSLRVSDTDVDDLNARLTAPNGATTNLVRFTSGTSWGAGSPDCNSSFLVLDDETPFELTTTASGSEAFHKLFPPYAGTAQPDDFFVPLAVMDGGPIRGRWTLTMLDLATGSGVGTIHCWKITVKPVRSARGRG